MRRLLVLVAVLLASLIAAPPAQAAYPTLGSGATGPNVTSLQHLLTAAGYATPADGAYGSGTAAAVTAYQSAAGLAADGIAGPATLAALVPVLRQGDTGPAVEALQVQLEKTGADVAADGDFGPATDAAVRAFQDSAGLGADGVAGPATWEALFGSGGGSVPGEDYDSLSQEQLANARTIIGVGRAASVPEYGWVVALATAMQESRLVNVDYGDRDSLGLFQQRTSQGWGTEAQILDPVLSSQAFYGVASHTPNPGLLDIAGWESMPVTEAAQAVQRSGYPDAYAQWETLAREIVAHESGAPAIP